MLESEEERKFHDQCERFLSVDNIVDIIRDFKCCKNNCLQVISPNYKKANYEESLQFIVTLRNKLLAKSKEDRAENIFKMLKCNYKFLFINKYYHYFLLLLYI